MEIFSIADKINVDKLNTKIEEFIYRKGHRPYIFANRETLDALVKPVEQELKFVSVAAGVTTSFKSCFSFIGKYQDNKMFEDNTLKFGEIELR